MLGELALLRVVGLVGCSACASFRVYLSVALCGVRNVKLGDRHFFKPYDMSPALSVVTRALLKVLSIRADGGSKVY